MIFARIGQLFVAAASVVLLVGGTAGCMEGKGGPGSKGPTGKGSGTIEIVGGDSVVWGDVPPGVLKHTIRVTNIGGDTLNITDVHASCGCTTAPIDKKMLLPGDTATIDVSMDVKTKSGPQHKTLTITSNTADSTRRQIQIPLTANILRDVAMESEVFPIVTTTAVGETGTSEVTIRNTGTTPLTFEAPTMPTPPPMIVTFDMTAPQQVAPGDSIRIVAHVKPLKSETAMTTVVIKTSSKLVPELSLPLTAQVNPQIAKQNQK
jgi:archaellum component FlaF (FlaF/FlaG flagellin family)